MRILRTKMQKDAQILKLGVTSDAQFFLPIISLKNESNRSRRLPKRKDENRTENNVAEVMARLIVIPHIKYNERCDWLNAVDV